MLINVPLLKRVNVRCLQQLNSRQTDTRHALFNHSEYNS